MAGEGLELRQAAHLALARRPHHPPPPYAVLQARYKYVDDLASVWCEWAEMELRHKNFKAALEVMRRATATPSRPRTREVRGAPPLYLAHSSAPTRLPRAPGAKALHRVGCAPSGKGFARILRAKCLTRPNSAAAPQEEKGLPVQDRLYRSLRCWALLADLEESLGTLESARAVYERVLDLRIATPQVCTLIHAVV